jgi:hypothetical protein
MNSIVQTASHIAVPGARRPVSHLWLLAFVLAAVVAGALLTATHQGPVDPDAAWIVGP